MIPWSLIGCLVGLALSSVATLSEEAGEGAKSSSEEAVQKALRDEALKLEIEMTRAEREGEEAVYSVRFERTKKLAEKANQSKSLADVLIFEKVANETLAYFDEMTRRQFQKKYERYANFAGRYETDKIIKEMEAKIDAEKKRIEGLLDDSLRNL